jgi:hypothetical protein
MVHALSHLALTSSSSEDLKFAAINVLVSHCFYATDNTALDASKIGDVLHEELSSKTKSRYRSFEYKSST